jgi:hypothetical protein
MIEVELFDGTVLEFPEGTSQDVIDRVAKSETETRRQGAAPAPGQPGPFTPERLERLQAEGLPQETLSRQQEIDDALMAELQGPAPERSPVGQAIDFLTPENPMRSLRLGAQGSLRGAVADTLGMPVDLLTGLMNAGIDVGNLVPPLFGSEARMPNITNPIGGSQSIADGGAAAARAVGIPVEDPDTLEGSERLGYNINRFGSGAAAAGFGLGARAATTLPKTAPSSNVFVRALDGLTDAYRGAGATRTFTADVAAGAGAGAGLTAAEGFETDNPYARAGVDTAAMLGGGLAGAGSVAGLGKMYDMGRVGANLSPDPSIPFRLGTGVATSRRIGDLAGRIVQDSAADPQAAAAQIRERTAASRAAGDPLPTSGLASDDVGLIGLERTIRNDPQLATQFATRDEALQTGAADRVGAMRDPGADQAAGLDYARQRPDEIRQQRDAAALPILREAEASGAVVDAAPVAQLIDDMLASAKRPAVRSALQEARRFLNAPGSDNLDTTVSGLYETRKAINDLIEGRTDTPTGRFAKSELIEVRKALDDQINAVEPRLGQFIDEFRQGSRDLDVFNDSVAVARLAENETDIRNVAKRIFSGNEYGTENTIRQINEVFKDSPEAMRAWRAGVADVLSDRVTKASDGTLNVRELNRVYNQHRAALAEIYTPAEMASLDRASEMLAPLANLSRGVKGGQTAAPPTDIYARIEGAMLLSGENAVTTGMIVKRIKTAAKFVGLDKLTAEYKTARVIEMMQFNPELAVHLLERPVSEGVSAAWNQRLQNLMAGAQGARSFNELQGDEDESVEDSVMRVDVPTGVDTSGAGWVTGPDGRPTPAPGYRWDEELERLIME